MDKKGTLIKLKVKERKLRQQIIMDAAGQVFEEKSYDKASMAEIAKVAGIAKSSIYTYFKDQEDLYAAIVCRDADAFVSMLDGKIRGQGARGVDISITCFLEYYLHHKAQWRMITHLALHGSKGKQAIQELNRAGRNLMDLLERVVLEAGCRPDRARLRAHTLFSCLSGILIAYRNYPGRTDEERRSYMLRMGMEVREMITALLEKEGIS